MNAPKSDTDRILLSVWHARKQIEGAAELIGRSEIDTSQSLFNVKVRLHNIEQEAIKIKTDTHDMQRYATTAAVAAGIGGSGLSLMRMSLAIKGNRPREAAAEGLHMVGSAFNLLFLAARKLDQAGTAAKWMGPVGSIIGQILEIAVAGLQLIGVKEKSIGEELKEALVVHQGKDNLDRLAGLLDSYQVSFADLVGHLTATEPNSLSWDEAKEVGKLVDSTQILALGTAESYLRRELGSANWEDVLEAYLFARQQSLQNVLVTLALVRKFDDDGKPTSDLGEALSVVAAIVDQSEEFLKHFTPIAVEQRGTRWFIGDNTSMYRTEHGVDIHCGDGAEASQLAVVADDHRRIWYIGTNNRKVYTGKGDLWDRLDGVTADALAVTRADTKLLHVHTLNSKKIEYHRWDEATRKLIPDAERPYGTSTATEPTDLAALAAAGDDVYVLDGERNLWIWDREGARRLPGPDGNVKPLFVSATPGHVYLADQTMMWRKPADKLAEQEIKWTELETPDQKTLNLPNEWKYKDLFACDDGSVLTVIGEAMYCLYGNKWNRCLSVTDYEHDAERVDQNLVRKVVKAPISCGQSLATVQGIVDDIKRTKDHLRDFAPALEIKPPVLVEVKVTETGFQPDKITVREGGRVVWVWVDDNHHQLMYHQATPTGAISFGTDAGATHFEWDFLVMGDVHYETVDGAYHGTIEVK